MKLIVCLDEQDGMSFNHRRQSTDRRVIEHILSLVGEKELWLSPYSAKLFQEGNLIAREDFLEKAQGYAFAETASLLPAAGKIERLLVYRWDKTYPADRKYPFPKGKLCYTRILEGYSHEKITLEVYTP